MSREDYLEMLTMYNQQRVKDFAETVREEVVRTNPDDAWTALMAARRGPEIAPEAVEVRLRADAKPRARINRRLKGAFLEAVLRVLESVREHWPVSERQVHYRLLNDPPVINTSTGAQYESSRASSSALSRILTQARLEGDVPMHAICDETRPVETWRLHDSVADFVRDDIDYFLNGYQPNLQRSQPGHIEIVTEKNTTLSTCYRVAREYGLPVTSGRGHSSLPPRAAIAQRFLQSGKDRLVLLLLADHDPAGMAIMDSFARSMSDDFGLDNVTPVWVALRPDQVERFALPPNLDAKRSDMNYPRFVERFGKQAYELEALSPDELEIVLREAVAGVIDADAHNIALDAAKQDAVRLAALRRALIPTIMNAVRDA